MAIVIPEGYYNISLVYQTSEAPGREYVTSFGVTDTGEDRPVSTIVDLIRARWIATGNPGAPAAVSSLYSLKAVRGIYMAPSGGITYENSTVSTGTYSSAMLPANCSWIVDKRTNLGGRRGRGRMFVPAGLGLVESEVNTAGLVSAGQSSVTQGYYDTFLGWFNGQSLNMVLFHSAGVALAPTTVTSLVVQRMIGTQRDRLR